MNVRLFQLINHYDPSNGQPDGHGIPLSSDPYSPGKWIDQRPDWNEARMGRGGDPRIMTYASRTPLHEAAKRGSAETVTASSSSVRARTRLAKDYGRRRRKRGTTARATSHVARN